MDPKLLHHKCETIVTKLAEAEALAVFHLVRCIFFELLGIDVTDLSKAIAAHDRGSQVGLEDFQLK